MSVRTSRVAVGSENVLARFTAIDLDRTILKSTALFYQYIIPELIENQGYSESIINEVRRQETLRRGQAFDFVQFMIDLACKSGLPPLSVEALATNIINSNREHEGTLSADFTEAILVEGTLPLLQKLANRPNEKWGILTSGGDMTQSLKCQIVGTVILESLGLTLHAQVISGEQKAMEIAGEWYSKTTRVYRIPSQLTGGKAVYANNVRLIDDKIQNLTVDSSISNAVRNSLELILVQAAEQPELSGVSLIDLAHVV